ncbi:MAG: OmpA family protein [Proteobacteria bacterium]|nr:OmpA family protein [Pseudomonadota bacterium]
MFSIRKKRKEFDIWPAYVDILATVLMVLIFVLMTFVIAQLYLNDSIVNKDLLINSLNQKIITLDTNLEDEKDRLSKATLLVQKLENDVKQHLSEKDTLKQEKECIAIDLKKIQEELSKLTALLDQETEENKKDKLVISDLRSNLEKLNSELSNLKDEKEDLAQKNEKFKDLNRVHLYRSEFFTKLKSAIGDIDSIKIVGDRFVFQSELLFDIGSAELGNEGEKQLTHLSKVLKEISDKIPDDINWILRVDGHTDKKPIKMAFPSNWELSSARAIAVVKYLIKKGIPEKRLVAAGFGEFQPLTTDKNADDKETAKNRRIEFKLDQR